VGNRVQGRPTEIAPANARHRNGWSLRQTLRGRLLLGALIGLLAAAAVFAIVSSELIRSQTAQATRSTFDAQAQRVAALVGTETVEQTASGVCRSYTSADLRAFVGPGARLYIDAPPLCPGTAQVTANQLPSEHIHINPTTLAAVGYEHVDFRLPGASSATVATAAPIIVGGQSVGAIVLAKPASAVATSWSEVVPNLLLAALIGLIPAFILTLWITGRVMRPLREMESAADRVAAGDLTASVPPAGTEELDHVATAFNSMVGRLRERDDRSRAFLMNVTHDLRTPLTAIRGHAAALRDGIVPEKDIDRSLGAIEGEAARLSAMVTDLLDLARLDAHQFRVQPAVVNPAEILDAAYTAQVAVADARGVTLTTDIGRLPEIVTDSKRFRQVIDNLLSNAIRWTPPGGTVTLDAYPDPDGGIRVRIVDSGPGVPLEQREEIFAPFHAHPDPEGRTGAGLGLAICRQLARALGGDVVVDDGPLGGAMFLVALPAAAPAPHLPGE
jgi:two-component system OmpR family sensor kinase